ncbi:MAG: chromosome segregation protein SMC [Euryarchaeota archaeon TMED248]|nr:MAG: chromosome segregation protein SMC [Euryarchaeota archaeon TMED248]
MGMYLKEIQISNFKSFKGEVTIPLDRGFTAITGPNGSGKSNCGDAIQFVLGPRSNKTIRAQNSKDLIFNGGKNSKPARSCEVTLIFANPVLSSKRRRLPIDSDEVRMTRKIRLTKSNNVVTQYLLDGEESSQKSFHRILGAANARPDGYNIVLQGDVTSLAKMTSKERRKVLDSVAGVTSYDEEIRKADKQKENVEAYIERIGLLEEEQKVRLKELRKEKDIAVKAKDLADELNQARTTAYQSNYASQLAEKEYQLSEQSRYLEEANELESEVREGAKSLLALEDRIGVLQKQIEELMGGDSNGLNTQIFDLHLKIDGNKDKIGDMTSKISENQAELENLIIQLEEASSAEKEFSESLDSAKQDLEAAHAALKEAQLEEQEITNIMESSNDESAELSRNLSKAIKQLEDARNKLSEVQSEVDRTAAQAEIISEQLSQAQNESEEARLTLGELELKGQELSGNSPEKDRNKLSKQLIDAQNAEQKLVEESQIIETKLRETERKLERTRAEMETSSGSKGMAGGAAAVISARDRGELKGIIGSIAELCAPIDDSHESALATAIGGAMTSLVVENDEVAAQAIRWLAENRAGRATFLPLNKLTSTRAAGKALMVSNKPGVIGFAHELLDYDPKIDTVIRFVLRNTLIVDSMSTARAHMGGIRLVTLRGDVTEAGGAMIGGSKRKMSVSFGGRIKGASEVEKLSGEVEKFRLMSDTVSAALVEARRQQQIIRVNINQLSDGEDAVRLQEWRAELKQAKTNHNKSLGAVAEIEKKLSELESLARSNLEDLDSSQNQVEIMEAHCESAREAVELASPSHLKDRMHSAQMKRLDAEGLKSKAETALESGSTHRELLSQRVSDTQTRIDSLDASISKDKVLIEELKSAVETDSIELKEKQEELSEFLEENKGLEDERLELVDERGSLRTSLTQKATDAQSRKRMSDEVGRSLITKETALVELLQEMKLAGIEPAESNKTLPSVGESEKKVRSLERRMEAYGPVNMLAIEQFESCEARLNDMKDDFKILQKRRNSLIDVTEKLETQRKDRLVKVLEQVNENFKVSYNVLSDGGKGELYLENPDDPFKGGLELWAKPKGKSSKVSRLQLSGGEQSMAALALIFAIQDYDPSPFYYFDEVDQNLDGTNAERIAEMCRQRSKKAQFIMVTLRKVSLRLADHHIGITHGGDGCSRRIVDFDRERAIKLGAEAEKEAEKIASMNALRRDEAEKVEFEMPEVPEPLSPPGSLGGLLNHIEKSQEDSSMIGLGERTAELTEDIEEMQDLRQAVSTEEASEMLEEEVIESEEEI